MLKTIDELTQAAREIRKNLLELFSTQVIHIGGNLSVENVINVLWQYQMM